MRDGREGEKAIRQKDKKMMCYYELVLSYSSRSIHRVCFISARAGDRRKGALARFEALSVLYTEFGDKNTFYVLRVATVCTTSQ